MSRSIYVDHYGELMAGQREDIERLFKDTHDQEFKAMAGGNASNDFKGELTTCPHTVKWVGKGELDEFIAIPCHWDYEHAIQTAKDITEVMLRLEFDKFQVTHSY